MIETLDVRAEDRADCDLCLFGGDVSERGRIDDVADRVDVGRGGAIVPPNRDGPPAVAAYPAGFEAKLPGVRRPARRDENPFAGQVALLATHRNGQVEPAVCRSPAERLRATAHRDASRRERPLDDLRRIWVFQRQHFFPQFQKSDLHAECVHRVGEFASDGARPDDRQRPR